MVPKPAPVSYFRGVREKSVVAGAWSRERDPERRPTRQISDEVRRRLHAETASDAPGASHESDSIGADTKPTPERGEINHSTTQIRRKYWAKMSQYLTGKNQEINQPHPAQSVKSREESGRKIITISESSESAKEDDEGSIREGGKEKKVQIAPARNDGLQNASCKSSHYNPHRTQKQSENNMG